MAGIDKIYGTNDQYDELKNWLSKNKSEFLNSLYEKDDFKPGLQEERAISNFKEVEDMWLVENCPIQWVVDFIKGQYGI